MHKLSLALCLLASVIPSLAAVPASSVVVQKYDGDVNEGSYIVKVRDGAQKSTVLSGIASMLGGDNKVTHDWDSLNSFAGYFDGNLLGALLSSMDVEYIAEDGIMKTSVDQTDAPWNLARVSTRAKLSEQDPYALDYTYRYNDKPGFGVDIYVVDTGIFVDHPDFGKPSRATWGGAFCQGCAQADGNGHGTHVAGTAGGTRFGIAKAANLIAVKVLSDAGSGAISDIVSGLEWVGKQHGNSPRSSIATMSLGGSYSQPMNDAVKKLTELGVHCTVAAGNSNEDASMTSPASTEEAITVGATDIADSRAFYSNYGSVVDVFAPGSNVTSTWPDGKTQVLSGTSMATPNVAGLVAYFLSAPNPPTTPAAMSDYIKQVSTKNALSGMPPSLPIAPLPPTVPFIPGPTNNYLAFNNFGSS